MSKALQIASLLDSNSAAGWLHMASGQTVEDAFTKFEIRIPAEQYSDVGPKINAAAAAFPGAKIMLPYGNFTFSTAINITTALTTLSGAGGNPFGTTLIFTGTPSAQGAIRFGPADPTTGEMLLGCGISNLLIRAESGAKGAGVGLLAEHVLDFYDSNVLIQDFKGARDLAGFSNYHLRGPRNYQGAFGALGAGSYGVRIRAGWGAGAVAFGKIPYGFFMDCPSLTASGSGSPSVETMILIQCLDGFYASPVNYLGQAKYLIGLDPANALATINNINLAGFLDGNIGQSDYGLRILDTAVTGAPIQKINVIGLNCSTFLEDAIYVNASQAKGVAIVGCQLQGSKRGANIIAADTVSIIGNTVNDNGTAANPDTGGIRYTQDIEVLHIATNTFRSTASGARDVIAAGYPAKLEQAGNATDQTIPIPTINGKTLESGLRNGIAAGAHTYELGKLAIPTGSGAVLTVEINGLVGGVAFGRRRVVYNIIWDTDNSTWIATAVAGLGFTDSASADFFAFTVAVTGTGVTLSVSMTPSTTGSQFDFSAEISSARSRALPGADFL